LAFPAGLPLVEDDASVVFRDGDGNLVVQLGESALQQAAKLAEQTANRAEQIKSGTNKSLHANAPQ
jgi:hypothetical protein